FELRAVVGPEAAPERELVRARDDVDRVELDSARGGGEAGQRPGVETAAERSAGETVPALIYFRIRSTFRALATPVLRRLGLFWNRCSPDQWPELFAV